MTPSAFFDVDGNFSDVDDTFVYTLGVTSTSTSKVKFLKLTSTSAYVKTAFFLPVAAAAERAKIRAGFRYWEARTCLRFREVDRSQDILYRNRVNYILITRENQG